ncbi:MAG: hypothetical protein LBL61_01890 [Elusimicrobiota bacterium]|jgi:hypothetical protein|nr:hypothetical protein [Elusimicrobiota bacterium]
MRQTVKPDVLQDILVNILALDKGFKEYEFYHCFLGGKDILKKASSIKFGDAYLFLKNALAGLDKLDIPDNFPYYRKTYVKDLLACVLAQADKFVYKRKMPFVKLEEALTGSKILPPFNTARDFAAADKKVKALIGAGIKEFRQWQGPRVNGFKEVKKCSQNIIDEKLQAALQYSQLFKQFDLKEIINKMRIRIVNYAPNGSPCFFKYEGNYRGTMGLVDTKDVKKSFLNGFAMHEGVPGHFLYYCIKQYLADHGRGDAATLIDTFYSPENCLNEGLAVCSHLIFDKLVTPYAHAVNEAEKMLHKIFYNLWHAANIKPADTKLELQLLENFNMSGGPGPLIKYFAKDEKFYTPYYPYGIYYAESIIPKIKKENLGFLYQQHSINTLKKLVKEQK